MTIELTALLERPPVRRVRDFLAAHNLSDRVQALEGDAHSAQAAATVLGVETGAIIKTLLFRCRDPEFQREHNARAQTDWVQMLISGTRRLDPQAVRRCHGIEPRRPGADDVKAASGFSIGGVSPVGALRLFPTFIDPTLAQFPDLFAAAGHPRCIFRLRYDELLSLLANHTLLDPSCTPPL